MTPQSIERYTLIHTDAETEHDAEGGDGFGEA